MKVRCPVCGGTVSLEAVLNDAGQTRTADILGRMPREVARWAVYYVGAFRDPESTRGLIWPKAEKLYAELETLVKSGFVQVDRKPARPATPAMWGRALEIMLTERKLRYPLKNHNYLCEIVYAEADTTDRKQEVARNRTERNGTFARQTEESPPAAPVTLEYMREVRAKNYKPSVKDAGPVPVADVVRKIVGNREPSTDLRGTVRQLAEQMMKNGATLEDIDGRFAHNPQFVKYAGIWQEIRPEVEDMLKKSVNVIE